jgi:spermidine synthase
VVVTCTDDDALELRVNGVLVMTSAETSSEQLLGSRVLEALTTPPHQPSSTAPRTHLSLVVAGLGLGVTLARLLDSPAVEDVLTVEIEADLVRWHLDGTLPPPGGAGARGVLHDRRVRVRVGDVRDVVPQLAAGSADAIVLDVDNGPGLLVYDTNAAVYEESFLAQCAEALGEGGVLAVWSADEAPALVSALRRHFDGVADETVPVMLGRRRSAYHLVLANHLP